MLVSKKEKKKGVWCFSWICCKIWKNQSLLVRSIAHQLRLSALVHIAARSLCTCARRFRSYERAHTPYASAFDRRSPTLERTHAVSSIIILSSAPALDQLQHKLECTHAAGNTIDGLVHLRSIAHYLRSNAPLQTAPKQTNTWNFPKLMFGPFYEFLFLIFVVFVCFICFP